MPILLDISRFLSLHQMVSNQPSNLYPGGYIMRERLKLYKLSSYEKTYKL